MIVVDGLEEAQAFIANLKLTDADWRGPLEKAGRRLVRFAVTISPVITGSYQASHRHVADGKTMTMSVDPAARNTKTGVPVTRYAGAVEERHQVYARSAVEGANIALQVGVDVLRGKGL